ncbi:MAG: sigma-54-dependent Fis family transcriptional regulator [Alphaproteobacteria bacterium]|nr:sigma-54-dependent Fis family transcriptional regulator [Alphaproteobacteria bacterium]
MLLAVNLSTPLPGAATVVPDLPGMLHALNQAVYGLIVTTPELLPDLLNTLLNNRHSVPVAVVGPAKPAVGAKCIRLGAVEYLTDPVEPRLLEALCKKFTPAAPSGGPLAGDPKTQALLAEARTYAQSQATVLLRGESGAGKEVLARYIHENSPRKDGPFVAVNCAAIPEALLESELFGHAKGAFTGALAERKGKFAQAHGGTLLLDEISEMDLALQAKLLRAIQERVIDPVGADKPVNVDLRLIATTNRALEDYVAQGKFREDLYFRLSVVMLPIPPLRERVGDIAPLATYFLQRHAQANGFPHAPTLTPEAQQKLEGCYWKGNVRELENTLHRALLLAGPQAAAITADHIILSPMSLAQMGMAENNENARASVAPAASPYAAVAAAYGGASGNAPFVPKRLAELEREALVQTLAYTGGNRQYAADVLGISVTILAEKLAAAGLT